MLTPWFWQMKRLCVPKQMREFSCSPKYEDDPHFNIMNVPFWSDIVCVSCVCTYTPCNSTIRHHLLLEKKAITHPRRCHPAYKCSVYTSQMQPKIYFHEHQFLGKWHHATLNKVKTIYVIPFLPSVVKQIRLKSFITKVFLGHLWANLWGWLLDILSHIVWSSSASTNLY